MLCETIGLPLIGAGGVERIVVSLSDRHIPFGETDSTVTQFFELFRPEDGACVWEPY